MTALQNTRNPTHAMPVVLLVLLLTWPTDAHMPTFVQHHSCVFEDEASTQSMAIYTKIPAKTVGRCSFVINDIHEELQLSMSLPISHYTKSVADGLKVSIYAPSMGSWLPHCRVGWDGWHVTNNKLELNGSSVERLPIGSFELTRRAVFESWGIGGYVSIMGCSTPIASAGARHFISINNTNSKEARVCIGVGTKEEHFRSFATWVKLKWSLSLWRTWEWGLSYGAFVVVVSVAVFLNLYLLGLFLYRANPMWFCWFSRVQVDHVRLSDKTSDLESSSDSDSNSDCECYSSSDSDCDMDPCSDLCASENRAKSDQVVDAAGFIVLFWISGVAVVWLVVFFINCADIATGQKTGPKLIRWETVWSPLMYVYTLPVVVFTILYTAVRYSRFWTWLWLYSKRWNKSVVLFFLFLDITIAMLFDLIFPFSFMSAFVCLFCILAYAQFLRHGRRFYPTLPNYRNQPSRRPAECTRRLKRRSNKIVKKGNGKNESNKGSESHNHQTQHKKQVGSKKTIVIIKHSPQNGNTTDTLNHTKTGFSSAKGWVL